MHTFLLGLGLLVSTAGLAGCLLPVIPGPPLSFCALLLMAAVSHRFGAPFLLIMGAVTVAVTLLDYILPAAWVKKHGGSAWGAWGAAAGMLLGIFFFPPLGMLAGTFLGAAAGEAAAGRTGARAVRAAWGAFVGTMIATGLKLAASGVMFFYYVYGLFT